MKWILLAIPVVLLTANSYSQVQEAWVRTGIGYIDTRFENPALVLDQNENIYTAVNCANFNFDDNVPGFVETFRIHKFKSDGTKIFDKLEDVAVFHKRLVGLAVDNAGNIYCAVSEWRVTDPVTPRIGGLFAVYKYNANGSVAWKRSYGDGENNIPKSMALDAAGNVYVTGACKESGLVQNNDLADYLTVKWNSSGTFQWARRYDGASPGEGLNFANDIVVDGSGNVYITGFSQRDGQIGYATIKYNASGTELWVQRYTGTGTGDDRAYAITRDINGFVYVTGASEGAIATIKYNNDGAQLWVQRKGSGGGIGRAIKVDGFGNVYIAGNSSQTQSALVKYRFDGVELWTSGRPGALYSLSLDANGNVYTAGTAYGDGSAEKYNNGGISLWAKTYDSPLATGITNPISVSNNENAYLISFISTARDGNANPYYDARLIKYTQCNITCPQNITVNNNPGKCNAVVNFNPATYTGDCGGSFTYSHNTGIEFPVGTTTVTVTSDATGATCSFTVTVIDIELPIITNCPASKTVNTDPGVCYASAASVYTGIAAATDNCNPVGVTGTRSDGLSLSANYPVGITTITWTATDPSNNKATCTQTITVVDNEPPKITCPANLTVQCAAEVPLADISSVTASDNCSVDITHIGDVISNQTCANRFTLTRTYRATDPAGNKTECSQIITVNDNTPPEITGLEVSQSNLWPADHTLRDVMVNYAVSDNCVSNPDFTISITSNEPVNGVADGDTDPDWIIVDKHHIRLRAERASNGSGRIYTVTVTADDGCNPLVTATVSVQVVHNITGPYSGKPFKVGSTVDFSGEFWDKPSSKHTAKWLIDENTAVKGSVSEPSGNKNGEVTGGYKFNNAGVYKLQMNLTDQSGITSYTKINGDIEEIIVIYDPNGGYAYGGGYFNSPAGALASNPAATGKASYGFTVNYFKNSTYPKGETQFEFKVGEFEFNALNFDYLTVSNSMAQFRGTGKITGGQSGIEFIVTVVDGQFDGTGVDRIRMKIFNKNTGEVIYDNQPGASDADLPTQAVGVNSEIEIKGTRTKGAVTMSSPQARESEISPLGGLDVKAYPNPSAAYFTMMVQADPGERILMQVVDMYGRIIEKRSVHANSVMRFGERYAPGAYFISVSQGKQQYRLKLIKLSN